ncbi:MAG: hypothetical protein MI975_17475 [Cytophagales bacterium]|nr:hypothetical protein [Cytophagales bacterium]
MRLNYAVFLLFGLLTLLNCQTKEKKESAGKLRPGTFGYDADFLAKHRETLILKKGNVRLAVCPEYQGRVMTSSSMGEEGLSYGWLNYDLIRSGEILDKINPVGGEDRFWLGPEGGQYSIFFASGADFNLDHWQTPPAIDTETYPIASRDDHSVVFTKSFEVENYSKIKLKIGVRREISFVEASNIPLSIRDRDGLNYVAYQSINEITNEGDFEWTKSTGTVSIWILGMYNPSPNTTIMIPYVQGSDTELGPIVNDEYFGKVPAERLIVDHGLIYFKGDGNQRGKIGLNPKRALPVMGSYDEKNKVLTIVRYSKPEGVSDYVNSMWELQEKPFEGDVVNSYNDGPVDGKALGPFYELETSSPAAFLAPGASMRHVHQTFHIQGAEEDLDKIVSEVFNVRLQTVKEKF